MFALSEEENMGDEDIWIIRFYQWNGVSKTSRNKDMARRFDICNQETDK